MKNGKKNEEVSSRIITSSHALDRWMYSILKHLQNWSNVIILKRGILFWNMGLVSYNKRILYAAVGAPCSKHDSRLLKNTQGNINNVQKVKYFPTNIYI